MEKEDRADNIKREILRLLQRVADKDLILVLQFLRGLTR